MLFLTNAEMRKVFFDLGTVRPFPSPSKLYSKRVPDRPILNFISSVEM